MCNKKELKNFAEKIYEKYNTKVSFCKIFGNRWSYFSGCDNHILNESKYLINDNWGFFASKKNISDEMLEKIKLYFNNKL